MSSNDHVVCDPAIRTHRRHRGFAWACWVMLAFATLSAPGEAASGSGWTPAILTDPAVKAKYFLPDYSFAGYHWGEVALPRHAATLQVTNFGALPDDEQDDPRANFLQLAITELSQLII